MSNLVLQHWDLQKCLIKKKFTCTKLKIITKIWYVNFSGSIGVLINLNSDTNKRNYKICNWSIHKFGKKNNQNNVQRSKRKPSRERLRSWSRNSIDIACCNWHWLFLLAGTIISFVIIIPLEWDYLLQNIRNIFEALKLYILVYTITR